MRAVELFEQGRPHAHVAGMLGVSPESVRRWQRQWEQGGAPALRRSPAAGRLPKLDDAQVVQVRAALEQGAQAHGFEAGLWTLERVGLVVERVSRGEAGTGIGVAAADRATGVESAAPPAPGGRAGRVRDRPMDRP